MPDDAVESRKRVRELIEGPTRCPRGPRPRNEGRRTSEVASRHGCGSVTAAHAKRSLHASGHVRPPGARRPPRAYRNHRERPPLGAKQSIASGMLTLFCRHTSASLLIQENAARAVRSDLEKFFDELAPEGADLYEHDDEGPDDMPAHLKTALTQVQLNVPVMDGQADARHLAGHLSVRTSRASLDARNRAASGGRIAAGGVMTIHRGDSLQGPRPVPGRRGRCLVHCRRAQGRRQSPSDEAWARAADIARKVKPPTFPDRLFDITKFGARADGTTLNTAAIAKAIAACAKAGGGRVLVPAGQLPHRRHPSQEQCRAARERRRDAAVRHQSRRAIPSCSRAGRAWSA